MVPSRVAGGLTQSSASSGIFFQGDGQSQNIINSHLSSSFGNSANSIPGTGRSNLGPLSGDANQAVFNSVANSGPSVGASSLVTDANSGFSGGPQLQRSASVNTESFMRLPASPMSFNSNNLSVSGSSAIDGPSTVQQADHTQQASQNQHQHQQQHQHGGAIATSLSSPQIGQVMPQLGPRTASTFMHDPSILSQIQKKQRLDIKQEDILQQQVIQQLLQRQQDPMQLSNHNPQLQVFIQQQQRLRQQQLLQAMPQMQRAQLLQQQQQQQQQQQHQQQQQQQHQHPQKHLQQQNMQAVAGMKNPYETGGVCARRLMQYLYHQRQRPAENTIAYWRKFVAEYYAPRAKRRWCLSLYDDVGHHALGVFPQAAMDAWHCDICGSKSGRGFEATYEVLPLLNEIKFGSGVIDELLFVDLPRERRFASGIMMLEYAKAVQESVYEHLRVIREGQLRIIFSQDLKILSWEFCARRHEDLLPRRLVAPQVNQLLHVAQKCQSTIAGSGSDGVYSQDLQTNSNMVVTAGRHLAKSLEMQSLNDLGFPKRYARCLQIAEVVNSMKDLIDFCRDNKAGPIEGLKNFPRHSSTPKPQMQKMQDIEQLASMQGLPTDRNSIDKLMSMHPGMNNQMGNNQNLIGRGALSGSAAAAMALTNYQNMLMRQNSMASNPNSIQQESSSINNFNHQSPSSSYQGGGGGYPSSMQNLPVSGLSSPQLGAQQQQHQMQMHQMQQRGLSNGMLHQIQQNAQAAHQYNHQAAPQRGQNSHPQMMQQLLQDMSNSNGPTPQQKSVAGPNVTGNGTPNHLGYGNNSTGTTGPVSSNNNMSPNVGGGLGATLSKSNSFKAAANSDSSAGGGGGNSGYNRKSADLPQSLLSDEMVGDISHDFPENFPENGFFNSDLDDTMGYSWKG